MGQPHQLVLNRLHRSSVTRPEKRILGQSSNDSFPTAMSIAAVTEITYNLIPALSELHAALARRSRLFLDMSTTRVHATP